MTIKIITAFHKPYPLPEAGPYLPLQVGATGKADIIPAIARDDTGENISRKNPTFCELTGLYWAWKNLGTDVGGLCHYRRYFGSRKNRSLLDEEEILTLLSDADIILPEKRHYWIETRGKQYAHAHNAADLICTEQVLREKFPAYLPEWQHMLDTRSGHICNMFIMRRDRLNAYCEWLFDVLFTVESRLDISGYTPNDQRVFGYLGERLLDVWVWTNDLRIAEVPMLNLESQHWPKKIWSFLKRKTGRKN